MCVHKDCLCVDLSLPHPDTLISPSGKILIPGIREAVASLSDEEWKMYQDIEFDIESFKSKIGVSQLMYSNKVMHRGVDLKKKQYLIFYCVLLRFSLLLSLFLCLYIASMYIGSLLLFFVMFLLCYFIVFYLFVHFRTF